MAHPYAGHRQNAVERSRVGKITRGYASGGAIKGGSDDDSKVRKMSASLEREVDPEGGVAKRRADRPQRAKGGAVKGKHNAKTIVNVITGGHPAGGALPPGPPMAPPGPPMGIAPAAAMPPPRPPMAPPMGPGGPPPMPMRAKGGRIIKRADGGMAEDPADEMRRLLQSPAPDDKATPQQSLAKMRRLLKEGTTQRANGGKVQRREEGGRTRLAGDVVNFPISMQESDARRVSGMKNPAPSRGPAPSPLKGPGAAANGGRIEKAKGGRVNQGTKVFEQSKRAGTPVTHDNGKADLDDMNRKRVVTFQTGGGVKSFMAGGRVESPDGVASASKLPGGGGGGEARLAKAHRAGRK